MSKKVLVLFYDHKDKERALPKQGITLEENIISGFEGAIDYTIRVASPRHSPSITKAYLNEQRYDGIIVVAGLSANLDLAGLLLEQLYEQEEFFTVAPRGWQEIKNNTLQSKYFGQETPIPIIGVPTIDDYTHGELAFTSMIFASRPSSNAAVGIDQGYHAARALSRILTTTWKDVHIHVPAEKGYDLGCAIVRLLDTEFKPWEDAKIPFGIRDRTGHIDQSPGILHVVLYDTFTTLGRFADNPNIVVGVYSPSQKIDLGEFTRETCKIPGIIHTRPGYGENAAMFVAQCLYTSHPELKPARFTNLLRTKTKRTVEEYRALRKKD